MKLMVLSAVKMQNASEQAEISRAQMALTSQNSSVFSSDECTDTRVEEEENKAVAESRAQSVSFSASHAPYAFRSLRS